MNVLVTGGFGYIGGRLAQVLHRRGHKVMLASRRAMQRPAWLPDAEVVQIDWADPEQMTGICAGVDAVAHLAGMNAEDCETDPAVALAFNGGATARLVAAAITAGARRFLYLSTAHVYSSPLVGTISETTVPRSQHPYATSHLVGEVAVRSASSPGKIEAVVARLSNAFGPPAHVGANCWMLLLNDLVQQALDTRRIVLRSSGLQRRDFIPVGEACRALAHLLDLPKDKLGDGLFNIGSGWSPTVLEMAERVAHRVDLVLGYRPTIERLEEVSAAASVGLSYQPTKLMETGFSPAGEKVIDEEIDSLIRFYIGHRIGAPS